MSATAAHQIGEILANILRHLVEECWPLQHARLVNQLWAAEARAFLFYRCSLRWLGNVPPDVRQYPASYIRRFTYTEHDYGTNVGRWATITFPLLEELELLARPFRRFRFAERCASLRLLNVSGGLLCGSATSLRFVHLRRDITEPIDEQLARLPGHKG
jgi:hypothetical protein